MIFFSLNEDIYANFLDPYQQK